jgi:hypothetical protein
MYTPAFVLISTAVFDWPMAKRGITYTQHERAGVAASATPTHRALALAGQKKLTTDGMKILNINLKVWIEAELCSQRERAIATCDAKARERLQRQTNASASEVGRERERWRKQLQWRLGYSSRSSSAA